MSNCEGCPSQGTCGKDKNECGLKINPNNHIKKVIAVMSGKGGVGKSTITTLLAKAAQAKGLNVGVMDADITGPSIPRLFGLQNETAYGDGENQIYPVIDKDGIKTMSINYLIDDENTPVIWRGPIVAGAIQQFWSDVLWEDLDVLF
ncbi:MAG: P-loop NTPase, partial [Traorella sp.]